jgi:hypothetical protein
MHEITVVGVNPMDANGPYYWVCSCGAASDETWPEKTGAIDHYNAVHA